MREYAKKSENQSHTRDSNPKASRQAPVDVILQRYKEQNIQRYAPEEDEEVIQEKPNNTGLPDNLKAGIENLSGYSMDDVKVHYNSDKPAQLQALAYTQGTDIHVASGQEKHLPHEAWHVVQQKQGRVQPTMQLQGMNVNDNNVLEREADRMGMKVKTAFKNNVNPKSDEKSNTLTFSSKSTVQCITPQELEQAKRRLRRADYGVLSPNLPHIRARRSIGESPAQYYDFMCDTRKSISKLMNTKTGNRMLTEIEQHNRIINPRPQANIPSTVVDIYSGRNYDMPMSQKPKVRRGANTLLPANYQGAYRYAGKPGQGLGSIIHYDETENSANRPVSLGHELVHAWRAANGLAVSSSIVSPRSGYPILNLPHDRNRIIEKAIDLHALQQEEFETVGLVHPTENMIRTEVDPPHTNWVPTENMIRTEMKRPLRQDYSGVLPGNLDLTITNLDNGTDDRNWFEKIFHLRQHPHYVQNMVNYLEDSIKKEYTNIEKI